MADINILGQDVERDPGLETAILISLFTDRRASIEDELPDNSQDQKGWWADTEDDKIGSKLWLLMRDSITKDLPGKLNQYVKECLSWMIEDGVAKEVTTSAERVDTSTMLVTIQVLQPDGQEKFYKYSYNWTAEILKRG